MKEYSAAKVTLGEYLASIRADRRMTLRQVEKATENKVSNAYLSQLENDKIQQPSPNILHALSEVYGIDYGHLMAVAGHRMPSDGREQRHTTLADYHLTEAEEAELIDYLSFIRSRKRRKEL